MQENITDEGRKQIIEKAKAEGMSAAAFMLFTMLLPYASDFFPQLQNKSGGPTTALVVITLMYFYRALKKLQPLCRARLILFFTLYWTSSIAVAIFFVLATVYEAEQYMLILFVIGLFVSLVFCMICWMILNFKLAKITQKPLFKIYALCFVASVISSIAIVALGATKHDAIYYVDTAFSAITGVLLIVAWHSIDKIEDM